MNKLNIITIKYQKFLIEAIFVPLCFIVLNYTILNLGNLLNVSPSQMSEKRDVYSKEDILFFVNNNIKVLKNSGIEKYLLNTEIIITNDNKNLSDGEIAIYDEDKGIIELNLNGLNELIKKESNLLKAFKTKEILFAFIFYHEFGHLIERDLSYWNIEHLFLDYNDKFPNYHSYPFFIRQYKEAFADVFALYMLHKTYPKLKIEQVKIVLAGYRYSLARSEDVDSIYEVAPSILVSNIKNESLEKIIENSENAAYTNMKYQLEKMLFDEGLIKFYSVEGFEQFEKISISAYETINNKKID
jgi:hypothetical protein